MSENPEDDRRKGLFRDSIPHDDATRACLLRALPDDQRWKLESLLNIDDGAHAAGLFESFQPVNAAAIGVPVSQLGAYRIESKLGEGGTGAVFKATHEKLRGDLECERSGL